MLLWVPIKRSLSLHPNPVAHLLKILYPTFKSLILQHQVGVARLHVCDGGSLLGVVAGQVVLGQLQEADLVLQLLAPLLLWHATCKFKRTEQ